MKLLDFIRKTQGELKGTDTPQVSVRVSIEISDDGEILVSDRETGATMQFTIHIY